MLLMNRRRTLMLLGMAGTRALALGPQGLCVSQSPTATEGPYWVDEKLNRTDIRVDPTDNLVQAGLPLTLQINVQEISGSSCGALAGAWVDLWHCNAAGLYSDESANNTVGKKYLRGYQVLDDNGQVNFTTIYPGWYSGRAVHIHLRVRTFNGTTQYDEFTSQLFFNETVTDAVHAQTPYSVRGHRDTTNTTDMVYSGMSNPSSMLLNLTKTATGYAGAITVAVNLKEVIAKPAIAAGGVVNAAGFQAGIAPEAWISIFGSNLAASTRLAATTDLVSGSLPTNLGGVGVQINNQAAFVDYISPSQINVQAPADATTGAVNVTVTNANGTSSALGANMQAVLPALFASGNYVAGVTTAKPGDTITIYGTGFGPTTQAVAPGLVFSGSYPLASTVTVMIGGKTALVSYAGRVAAGLDQVNVTVPSVADGDQAIAVTVGGVATQSGVLLKVKA